jgi:hypothetical protein
VEIKFYRDLDYKGLITGKGKLLAFWAEINKQAGRYEKLPFLVAKQNRMPAIVCLNHSGLVHELGLTCNQTVLISQRHDMYIMLADDFVKQCVPCT